MDDNSIIEVPAYCSDSIRIKTPRVAAYRDKLGVLFWFPLQNALMETRMSSLAGMLAARIESIAPRVRIHPDHSPYKTAFVGSDSEKLVKKIMHELSTGQKLEKGDALTEYLLRHVLTPDDFSFEDKILLFNHFADGLIRDVEKKYIIHLDSEQRKAHSYLPKLGYWEQSKLEYAYLASECYTLDEWKVWPTRGPDDPMGPKHVHLNEIIKNWLDQELAIRDMSGYDWSPLEFIFGESLPTLIQFKSATLKAELKVDYDTFMDEYRNFLSKIDDVLRLGGAMRHNVISLYVTLLGKFKVSISVQDKGKGVRLAEDISSVKNIAVEAFKAFLPLPNRL